MLQKWFPNGVLHRPPLWRARPVQNRCRLPGHKAGGPKKPISTRWCENGPLGLINGSIPGRKSDPFCTHFLRLIPLRIRAQEGLPHTRKDFHFSENGTYQFINPKPEHRVAEKTLPDLRFVQGGLQEALWHHRFLHGFLTPKWDLASTPFWKKQVCSKPMSAPRLKAGGVEKRASQPIGRKWFPNGILHRPPFGRNRSVQNRCREQRAEESREQRARVAKKNKEKNTGWTNRKTNFLEWVEAF